MVVIYSTNRSLRLPSNRIDRYAKKNFNYLQEDAKFLNSDKLFLAETCFQSLPQRMIILGNMQNNAFKRLDLCTTRW